MDLYPLEFIAIFFSSNVNSVVHHKECHKILNQSYSNNWSVKVYIGGKIIKRRTGNSGYWEMRCDCLSRNGFFYYPFEMWKIIFCLSTVFYRYDPTVKYVRITPIEWGPPFPYPVLLPPSAVKARLDSKIGQKSPYQPLNVFFEAMAVF